MSTAISEATYEEISHLDVIDELIKKKPKIIREVEALIEKYSMKLVFNGLVFNQVWEDPEVDKKGWNINNNDIIVTITSAGCNALDYLLSSPELIYALDINPTQNYLLELKISAIKNLDYEAFWTFFGEAKSRSNRYNYYKYLRHDISDEAKRFWDKQIKSFQKGFYRCGHLGLALRVLRTYSKLMVGGRRTIEGILNTDNQEEYYRTKIRPRMLSPIGRYFAGNPFQLSCMGIHKHQIDLLKKFNYVDFSSYVEHILDSMLGGDIPVDDNYFLHMVIMGRYLNREVAPGYLREKNFDILKENIHKITIKNISQYDFLSGRPDNSVTKFNLLDSVDWMKKEQFINLFNEIYRTGTSESVIIFRSGLYNFVLPKEIKEKFIFDKEKSMMLHEQDRSGVYGSFNIYYLNK
ncbi:MAG: BtaA family protein [Candidatus Eremiobacterota bacterium]